MKYKILIVDDDREFALGLSKLLRSENREFFVAFNYKKAEKILSEQEINLVLLDEHLPDCSGLDLLEKISKNYENIVSIIITASEEIPNVVRAIHLGAYNYIVKPFELENLEIIIKNALEKIDLTKKIKYLESGIITLQNPVFIGENEQITDIKEKVKKLVDHPFSSILLSGETGTGKGNLAKYIHWEYFQDMTNFVHISCADIPPNLLETELFGHEQGAFTDAKKQKEGLFEVADGGTLFLDEIDAAPLEIQSKLLNFLDNKKFRRVGSTSEIATDVRLITATNAKLEKLVEDKEFRKDLFFRLNMLNFNIPSLRERKEDISLLSNYFIELFNRSFSKNISGITNGAIKKLNEHDWPGNVRELKNVIENAMIFCENNEITDKDISITNSLNLRDDDFSFPSNPEKLLPLKEEEILYIKHVLKMLDGHKSNTAKKLNITMTTLLSKLKED